MPISINDTPTLQLIPADRQFIDLVDNRITMYKQIPYTVPEKLIIDIIKESARFFYKWHWRANSKGFYRLTRDAIKDFTHGDTKVGYEKMIGYNVVLPSYIQVVHEIYETDANTNEIAQTAYEMARDVQGTSTQGNTILGINNSLYTIEIACKLIEGNAFQSVFGETVPFNFNPLTKVLAINRNMEHNLILEVSANNNIQFLYQDDLFIRHVIGRTKQELKRLIAGHTTPLPGEVTLNAEEICNNIEDVTTVEEILKASSGIGDIILSR